jgi:hypothetical protein
MRTFILFLALLGFAYAESALTPVGRLVLRDGRILKNVVIRSYDAPSSKVLVLSEGRALLIPIDLLPGTYADKVRAIPSTADLVQTTPIPETSAQPPASPSGENTANSTPSVAPATPAAPPSPAAPVQPAPVNPRAEPIDPVEAHMIAATAHVRRYYKFEHRMGSNSIAVTDQDISIEETEPVPGWTGRYRTTGKVYLEIYDSIGGGSFRRAVRRFEILTEQKPGELIKVVDFTRR